MRKILFLCGFVPVIFCFALCFAAEEKSEGKTAAQEAPLILPQKSLFAPLIADPRWPHFSLSYQQYLGHDDLRNIVSTSFGETFIFYKDYAPFHSSWDIGMQAAVFAIFDLDAESFDLINADYWVCIPVSYRKDELSALLRVFHQSSHLGDEYLLGKDIERVNLSYESVSLHASYDFTDSIRVYLGGSYMLGREPSELQPWSTQYGVEIRSARTFLHNRLKPLGGADFRNWEENGWNTDVSIRAGVQLQSDKEEQRRIHFMLEYFDGYSPNGQFYKDSVRFIGLGVHYYF